MGKCGMNCMKYTLFIYNLIFTISGVGIIIAGAVVLGNIEDFYNFMESRMLALPVLLIVTGTLVFLISFLGCFGAIRESYNMLIGFAAGLLIIFIIELAVGITAASYYSNFHDALKATLDRSIEKYYRIPIDKQAWDHIQEKFVCCGIEGPDTWKGRPIPESCCREKLEPGEIENVYCKTFQKDINYLTTTGCYYVMKDAVEANSKCLIGVGIGIAFIEFVGVILACWLAQILKHTEK